MSEFIFHSKLPLPKPEYYQVKFSDYEDEMVELQNAYNASIGAPEVEWNAWNDIMGPIMEGKRAAQNSLINAPIAQQFRTLSQLGDALAIPEMHNPHHRVQYAFASGFLQQQRIVERMYGGKLAFEDTFHPVAEVINGGQQYFESVEDMHTAIRGHIDRLGRAGILATGHARGFIEKWAQEVYTPATYQHLGMQDIFKMGHGVALFGARAAHEEVNEAIGASIESLHEGPSSAASNDADTGDKE